MTKLDENLQTIFLPFSKSLDSPIWQVCHPSSYVDLLREIRNLFAKEDPLNLSRNQDFSLRFHMANSAKTDGGIKIHGSFSNLVVRSSGREGLEGGGPFELSVQPAPWMPYEVPR